MPIVSFECLAAHKLNSSNFKQDSSLWHKFKFRCFDILLASFFEVYCLVISGQDILKFDLVNAFNMISSEELLSTCGTV